MTSSSEPSTVAARGRAQAPWWAQRVHAVSDYLTIDFLGGPRQTEIGAPESDFADECLVRLHGVDDEIGLHAMNKNWPVIEALAKALLQKGKITEAEAVAVLEGNA